MSALDRLKNMKQNRGAAAAEGSTRPAAQTVCVTVGGYENIDSANEQERFVVGVRNDTKEEVRVYLRAQENEGKFSRSGVQEYASYEAKRPAKAAVAPGGEIRFDGVFADRENAGVLSANWGVVTSHAPGEARSAKTYVRVNKVKMRDQANGSVLIDVIRPEMAMVASGAAGLRDALVKAMTPVNAGNVSFAAIRVISGESVADVTMLNPARDESAERWTALPAEQTVDKFLATEVGKAFIELSESGSETVEVIRGTRMFMGAMTVSTLIEKGKVNDVNKRWRMTTDDENSPSGFVESWVTMRTLTDKFGNDVSPRQLFVTHVAAAASNAPVLSIESVPTAALIEAQNSVKDAGPKLIEDDIADLEAAMAAYEDDAPSTPRSARGPGM